MRYIKFFENFNFNIQDHIKYEDLLSKMYSNNIDGYRNIFPEYGDDNEHEEDYKYESKEKALEYIDNLISLFDAMPNPIPIYRTIHANDIKDIDLEYSGESWSYDKDCAINFGKRNNCNYLLEGTIDKRFVDWNKTLLVYMEFSENYSDEDENEIVVEYQPEIKNIKITPIKYKRES